MTDIIKLKQSKYFRSNRTYSFISFNEKVDYSFGIITIGGNLDSKFIRILYLHTEKYDVGARQAPIWEYSICDRGRSSKQGS